MEEAKDVVQEVMIRIWETTQKGTKIDNPEAWCMTCTRNKSLDRMKSKSFRSQNIEDQYDLHYDGISPEKRLEEKDMLSQVNGIMDQLSNKQKEVVRLRDFDGMSYKEIQEIMGLDMNQVKVNLFRARKYIKEQMEKMMKYGLS